jgi:AraC family transcriptional regulator, arabinose operon regulatory protein
MFRNDNKQCKSVTDVFVSSNKKWHDEVFLASSCQERFLVLSDVPEMKSQGIFMSGLSKLTDLYWVERAEPKVHTLLITIEGKGKVHTNDKIWDISPNTITILPAKRPFRFELCSNSSKWTMVWFLLYDIDRWKDICLSERPVMRFDSCEKIWSLTSLIYHNIEGRSTFRQLMISEVVKVLSNLDGQLSDTLQRVMCQLNLVESQLQQDWTVTKIAAQCYLSEAQLNRVVKQIVGMSTRSYLIALRMRKAIDLLQHKDWSIKMISLRLGYNDANNFSHRFRKYYGISPREYRNHHFG